MSLLVFVPSAAMRWERHWRGDARVRAGRSPPSRASDVALLQGCGDYWAFRRLIAAYGHFSGKAVVARQAVPCGHHV